MSERGAFILYTKEDGRERVERLLSEDMLWLSLKQMTERRHRCLLKELLEK